MVMDTTFCELRSKEVINLADGRRLGRVIDMVIDLKCGKVLGIIVPGDKSFSLFHRQEEIFISWCDICKIGDDVIIVELKGACPPPKPQKPCCPPPRRFSVQGYEGEDGGEEEEEEDS